MTLQLSRALRSQIAEANSVDTASVEEELWSRSSKDCYLCGGDLNRANDVIEVDHVVPQAEGGGHEYTNLRLAHTYCNRFKRNNSSTLVAPFLKFKRFYEENGSFLTFDKAQSYFVGAPKEVYVTVNKDAATFELPGGAKAKVPVFSEIVNGKSVSYCFLDLPLESLWNDQDVQPRDIKLNHLWSIAQDLQINPLHEQPACRLHGKHLLLFDGQHKALAKALNSDLTATYKVYLDLDRTGATVLVNSVQAKIKKLPLTPFELAAKLTDELKDALQQYENKVGQENASEEGFLKYLEPTDRRRAQSAIEAERIDAVMKSPDLEFINMIEMRGRKIEGGPSIKENMFQNKVLKKLLLCSALPSSFKGEEMRKARERELANVVRILNMLYEYGFAPQKTTGLDEDKERVRRLNTQASLSYVSDLLVKIVVHRVVTSKDDYAFLEKTISEDQWTTIRQDVQRMLEHPIWTADLDQGERTRAVQDAMSKNQGTEAAFTAVKLTPGYCVGVDTLPAGVLKG